ncbi:ABC-F family ATP-binding cassette domain-containing protein [Streptomyces sp. ISL-112]|uniref:ABC-F family ATP-binding cassette domain-containing protein n=1 Tax=unclassified Streptomyces TaxID=2593676 RepID=UPI001BE66ECA|nr:MULTISPECIES: ABC-F family ATP-binding cassette domain-containing protein [unclassified Streptomyces]MBT2427396.1 ABC-F family ATP-binding cassette domain-containing protein [Streptomyces sp. ISL-112]MBT2464431.1 ABC-F family ATP-binding cassette domain-containing protein [Streptomyces sp. ISL-63]
MSTSDTHISCTSLSFSWPDGTEVFSDFDLTVGAGRTGLIGLNGCGKSTLLRLIASELAPLEGEIRIRGGLGYLPQTVTLATALRVEQVLGIADRRAAIDAVEAGDVREELFAVIDDDWDVEQRAHAALDGLGLGHIGLDRAVGEVSGGECVLLRLAALFLARPGVLLLDEPTNNLDAVARKRLYDAVDSWTGALLVVSHDRELLERVDRIADLREGSVTWYGGNLSAYEEALAVEQEAAQRMVRAAESDVQRQKRELAEARMKLARRRRYGQKMWDTKREPKVVMGQRKRTAQESAGKHRILHTERLAEASKRLDEAESAVREDEEIRIELPTTRVHPGNDVLLLRDPVPPYGPPLRGELTVSGPERIALTGRNGAGKTALLRTIAGELAPLSGEATTLLPLGFLPQRLDTLDDTLSVADNVKRSAPGLTDNDVRARLARFLFKGGSSDHPAGTLSGGERFRATLAMLLLADPAPRLLLLDEPTNSLDLASVRRLTEALEAYEGALIVASHDVPFLEAIGVTRWLRLDRELRDTTPEEVRAGR